MYDVCFVGCATADSMNKALEDLYGRGTKNSVLWEGGRKSSSLWSNGKSFGTRTGINLHTQTYDLIDFTPKWKRMKKF